MKTKLLEAIYDHHEDRIIFYFYDMHGKIIGLNWHQGDEVDLTYFSEPDEVLTNVFKNLIKNGNITIGRAVKEAMEIKHLTMDWGN